MIIDRFYLRNIKSFGNNLQQIKINRDSPQLILLTGRNGSGKSTLQETIDLSIFNKVRGKKKKQIPLNKLPNRTNKNLDVGIEYENGDGRNITINKQISPNGFEIKVDGISYTNKFKLMNQKDKDELLGMDYDSFKSFISLSINDFLDFINLEKREKDALLNKLFNLEKISSYYSISNDILNNYREKINQYKQQIINNNSKVSELKNTGQRIKKNQQESKEKKLEEIKEKAIPLKTDLKEKTDSIKQYNEKISELETKIQELKNNAGIYKVEVDNLNNQLIRLDEKINLYNSGVCPYCDTDLKDDTHIHNLEEYEREREELNNKMSERTDKITVIKRDGKDYNEQKNKYINDRNKLVAENNNLKQQLKTLKEQYIYYENLNDNISIDEIEKNIKKLERENKDIEEKLPPIERKIKIYSKLMQFFDENGIRRNIIKKIVKPIDKNLQGYLQDLEYPYQVHLDSNFNAKIYDRGEEIDTDTPSNGEIKILNVLIAFSYIKTIRNIKKINILFIDEIFSSIDVENIGLILKLLKKMSKELNINIVVVHHGIKQVNVDLFDRIIKVKKDFFSTIEDSNEISEHYE